MNTEGLADALADRYLLEEELGRGAAVSAPPAHPEVTAEMVEEWADIPEYAAAIGRMHDEVGGDPLVRVSAEASALACRARLYVTDPPVAGLPDRPRSNARSRRVAMACASSTETTHTRIPPAKRPKIEISGPVTL